jgi:hypothetical protein
MLWIYLWGENSVQGVLDIMLSIENFESVSSNWGQLVLFNKKITNSFFLVFYWLIYRQ